MRKTTILNGTAPVFVIPSFILKMSINDKSNCQYKTSLLFDIIWMGRLPGIKLTSDVSIDNTKWLPCSKTTSDFIIYWTTGIRNRFWSSEKSKTKYHYRVRGLHRCWWQMLETKYVGDKFEMLMTDSECWWPKSPT